MKMLEFFFSINGKLAKNPATDYLFVDYQRWIGSMMIHETCGEPNKNWDGMGSIKYVSGIAVN